MYSRAEVFSDTPPTQESSCSVLDVTSDNIVSPVSDSGSGYVDEPSPVPEPTLPEDFRAEELEFYEKADEDDESIANESVKCDSFEGEKPSDDLSSDLFETPEQSFDRSENYTRSTTETQHYSQSQTVIIVQDYDADEGEFKDTEDQEWVEPEELIEHVETDENREERVEIKEQLINENKEEQVEIKEQLINENKEEQVEIKEQLINENKEEQVEPEELLEDVEIDVKAVEKCVSLVIDTQDVDNKLKEHTEDVVLVKGRMDVADVDHCFVDRYEKTVESQKLTVVLEPRDQGLETGAPPDDEGDRPDGVAEFVDRCEEIVESKKVTLLRDRAAGFQVAYTPPSVTDVTSTRIDRQDSLEVSGDYYTPGETFTEEVLEDGTIVRHRIIHTTKEGSSVDMEEFCEETPAKEETEVEDHEEILPDGTVHTTHTVRRHSFKKIKKHLKSKDGEEKEEEIKEVIPGSEKKEIIETFDEPPRMVHEEEEMDEVLDDGTKVHRKIVLNRMVHRIRTHQESFDSDHGRHVEDYEIDEIIPGTESAFLADPDSDSSSEYEEMSGHEVENIEEKTKILDDGTVVKSKLLTTESTHKTRSRSGSIDETEIERIVEEESITPSPRPRSPVDADPYDISGKQLVKSITKTSHIEESTKDDVVERTLEVVEDMIATGALKSPEDDYSDGRSHLVPAVRVHDEGDGDYCQEEWRELDDPGFAKRQVTKVTYYSSDLDTSDLQDNEKYEVKVLDDELEVREQLATYRLEEKAQTQIFTAQQVCEDVTFTEETVVLDNIGIYQAAVIREEVENLHIPKQNEEVFSDTFESVATAEETDKYIELEEEKDVQEFEVESLRNLDKPQKLNYVEDLIEETPVATCGQDESPITDLKYVTLTDPVTKELVRERIETIEEVVADMERKYEVKSRGSPTDPLSAVTSEMSEFNYVLTKEHELVRSEITEDASETTHDISEIKSEMMESLESQHDIESHRDLDVDTMLAYQKCVEGYDQEESENVTPAYEEVGVLDTNTKSEFSKGESISDTSAALSAEHEIVSKDIRNEEEFTVREEEIHMAFTQQKECGEKYYAAEKTEVENLIEVKTNVSVVFATEVSLPDESEEEIQEVFTVTKVEGAHTSSEEIIDEEKHFQPGHEELEDDQEVEESDLVEKELTEFEETEMAIQKELEYIQYNKGYDVAAGMKKYSEEKGEFEEQEELSQQLKNYQVETGKEDENYEIKFSEERFMQGQIEYLVEAGKEEYIQEQKAEMEILTQEQEEYEAEAEKEELSHEQEKYLVEDEQEELTQEQEEYKVDAENEELTHAQKEYEVEAERSELTQEQEEDEVEAEQEELTHEPEEYKVEAERVAFTQEQEESEAEAENEELSHKQEECVVEDEQEELTQEQEEYEVESEKEESTHEQEEYEVEAERAELTQEQEEHEIEAEKEESTHEQEEYEVEAERTELTQEQEEHEVEAERAELIQEQEEYEVEAEQEELTHEQEEYEVEAERAELTQEREEYGLEAEKEESTHEQEENEVEAERAELTQEQEEHEVEAERAELIQEQEEYEVEAEQEELTHEQEEYEVEAERAELTQEREEYGLEAEKEESTHEQEENEVEAERAELTQEQEEHEVEAERAELTQEREEYEVEAEKEALTHEQEEYEVEAERAELTQEREENGLEAEKEESTHEQEEYEIEAERVELTQEQEEDEVEAEQEELTHAQKEYEVEAERVELTQEQKEYEVEAERAELTQEQEDYEVEAEKEESTHEQEEYEVCVEAERPEMTQEQEEYELEAEKEESTHEQEEYEVEAERAELTQEREENGLEAEKEESTHEQEEYKIEAERVELTQEQEEDEAEAEQEELTHAQKEYEVEAERVELTQEQKEYEVEAERAELIQEQEDYEVEAEKEESTHEQEEYEVCVEAERPEMTQEQEEYELEAEKEESTHEQEEYEVEAESVEFTQEREEHEIEAERVELTQEQEEHEIEAERVELTQEHEEHEIEAERVELTQEHEEYKVDSQKEELTHTQKEYEVEAERVELTQEREEYEVEAEQEEVTHEPEEYEVEAESVELTQEQEEYEVEAEHEELTHEKEEYVVEAKQEELTQGQEEYEVEDEMEESTHKQKENEVKTEKEEPLQEQEAAEREELTYKHEKYGVEYEKEELTQEEYKVDKTKVLTLTQDHEDLIQDQEVCHVEAERDKLTLKNEIERKKFSREQEEQDELEAEREELTPEHKAAMEELTRLEAEREVITHDQDQFEIETRMEEYSQQQEELVVESEKKNFTEVQEEHKAHFSKEFIQESKEYDFSEERMQTQKVVEEYNVETEESYFKQENEYTENHTAEPAELLKEKELFKLDTDDYLKETKSKEYTIEVQEDSMKMLEEEEYIQEKDEYEKGSERTPSDKDLEILLNLDESESVSEKAIGSSPEEQEDLGNDELDQDQNLDQEFVNLDQEIEEQEELTAALLSKSFKDEQEVDERDSKLGLTLQDSEKLLLQRQISTEMSLEQINERSSESDMTKSQDSMTEEKRDKMTYEKCFEKDFDELHMSPEIQEEYDELAAQSYDKFEFKTTTLTSGCESEYFEDNQSYVKETLTENYEDATEYSQTIDRSEMFDEYMAEKQIKEMERREEFVLEQKDQTSFDEEFITSTDIRQVEDYEMKLSKTIVQEALYTSIESSKKLETPENVPEYVLTSGEMKSQDSKEQMKGIMDELNAIEDQQFLQDESSGEESEEYEEECEDLLSQRSVDRKETKLEYTETETVHRSRQSDETDTTDGIADMENSIDRLEKFTVEKREHSEKDESKSLEMSSEQYSAEENEIEKTVQMVIEERCHIVSSREVEFTKESIEKDTLQDTPVDFPETFIDRKEQFMELITDMVESEDQDKERFISCHMSSGASNDIQDSLFQQEDFSSSQQNQRDSINNVQGPLGGVNMGLQTPRSPFYPTSSTEVQDRSGSPSDLDEEINEMENTLAKMKQMAGFDEESPDEEFLSPEASSPYLGRSSQSSGRGERTTAAMVSSVSGSEYASQSDVEYAQSETTGTGSYYTAPSEIMSSSGCSAPSDIMTASECTAPSETMTGSEYTMTGSEHEDDEYESEGRMSADISQQIFIEQKALRAWGNRNVSSSSEDEHEDDTCRLDRPPSPSEFTLIASMDQSKLNISLGITSDENVKTVMSPSSVSETAADTMHVEPESEIDRDSLQDEEEYVEGSEEEEEERPMVENVFAGDRPPSPSEFTLIASQDPESLNKLLGFEETHSPEEQGSPVLWEQELEKAVMDIDAQSTASSDAALMIGLDRISAAGTDNNTMSGVSSESGQQPDGTEDQLYAETPDDEKDKEDLYQAYVKVAEDDQEGMINKDSDYDQSELLDTTHTQATLYEKDESKDTLISEADNGSPHAHFEEFNEEEEKTEESSYLKAEDSAHSKVSGDEFYRTELEEIRDERIFSESHSNVHEDYSFQQESTSLFENISRTQMQERKIDRTYFEKKRETSEMSEWDKQFSSTKYSVNSEFEASWSATKTESLNLCDVEGNDEIEDQNIAFTMALQQEDKVSSSSSEVAQLDDFDNQDVEIREASEETSEETDVEDQFSPVIKQTDEACFSFEKTEIHSHRVMEERLTSFEGEIESVGVMGAGESLREKSPSNERETLFMEEEEMEDFDHTELEPELCVLAQSDEQDREEELEISEHPSDDFDVRSPTRTKDSAMFHDDISSNADVTENQTLRRTIIKQETRDISPEDLEEKPVEFDFPDDYKLEWTDHAQEIAFQNRYEHSYVESHQYDVVTEEESFDEEEEFEPCDDVGKTELTQKQAATDDIVHETEEPLEASGGADLPLTPDEDLDSSSKSSSESGGVDVFDEQTGTYTRLPWEIAHQYKRQFSESFNEEQKSCVKAQKSIDLGTFYRRDKTKDVEFMERSFYDEADTSDIITVAKRKVTFEVKREESGSVMVSDEEESLQPSDSTFSEPYEYIDATHEAEVITTILESRQKVKHEIAKQVFDPEFPETPKQDSEFHLVSTSFANSKDDYRFSQRSQEMYHYAEDVTERISVVSRESRMAQQELLLQESFDEEDRSLSPSRDKSCKKLSTTFEEKISIIPPPHPTHFPMAVHSVGKSLADNEIYESSETERDSTEEKLSPIEETPGIDEIEDEDTTLKSTPPLEKKVTFQTDHLTTRASEQSVDDFKASSSSSELSVEPTLLAASYDLESGSVFHIVTAYDISPDTVEKQGPIEIAGKSILSSPEDDVFETDSTSSQKLQETMTSDTPAFILYGHLISGAGVCSSPPILLAPVSTLQEVTDKVDLSSNLLSASSKLEMFKHTERLDSKDGEDTTLQEDDMSSPREEEAVLTETPSITASPETEQTLEVLIDEQIGENDFVEDSEHETPYELNAEATINDIEVPCILNGPTEVDYIPEYDGGNDILSSNVAAAHPRSARTCTPPVEQDIIEPEMSSSYEAKPDIQQPEEEVEDIRDVEQPIEATSGVTSQTVPVTQMPDDEDYADSVMPAAGSFLQSKPDDAQHFEEESSTDQEEILKFIILTATQAKPDIQQPEDKDDEPDGEEVIQPSVMTTSQAKPDIQQPTEDQGNGHPIEEDPVQTTTINISHMGPMSFYKEQEKPSSDFTDGDKDFDYEQQVEPMHEQQKDRFSTSFGEEAELGNQTEQEDSTSPYSVDKEEFEEVTYEFSKETIYHGKRALDVDIADITFGGAYEEHDYAVAGAEPLLEHGTVLPEGEEDLEEEEEFEERPEEELIRLEEPPAETDDDTEENIQSPVRKEEKTDTESFEHISADFLRVGTHSDLDRPLSPTPDALRQGFFGGNFTPPQGGAFTPPHSGTFTPPISEIHTPPHSSHETVAEETVVLEQAATTFVDSILEDVKTQVSSHETSPDNESKLEEIDVFNEKYVEDDFKTEEYEETEYESVDNFSDSEKRRGITLVKQISEDIPGIVLTQYLHQEVNEDEYYGYSPQNQDIAEDAEEDRYAEEKHSPVDNEQLTLYQGEENVEDIKSEEIMDHQDEENVEDVKSEEIVDYPDEENVEDVKSEEIVDYQDEENVEDVKSEEIVDYQDEENVEDVKSEEIVDYQDEENVEDIKSEEIVDYQDDENVEDVKSEEIVDHQDEENVEDVKSEEIVDYLDEENVEDVKSEEIVDYQDDENVEDVKSEEIVDHQDDENVEDVKSEEIIDISHHMYLDLTEVDSKITEGHSETPTEQKPTGYISQDQKFNIFFDQQSPNTSLVFTEPPQPGILEEQYFLHQEHQIGFEDSSDGFDLYMSQEDHGDSSSVDSFATVVAAEAEDNEDYEPDENRLAEIASMTSSFTSDIHVPHPEESQKETSEEQGDTEDDDTSMETSQEWTAIVSEEKDRESDASIDSDRFEFVDRAALSIITEMSDEDKFEMIEREDLESEAGLSDHFGSSPDNNVQQSPGISTFRFFGRGTDRDDTSISSSLAEFEQMEKAIPFSSSMSSLERDIDKESFGGSYDERKFVGFPRLRGGEDSTSIASSLAEFEHLEQVLVVSSSASSVEKQTPESKSSGGSGDNTSNSISSSLADFEKIEQECQGDSDEKKSSVESSCRQSEASSFTSLNEFERLEREIAVATELEVEAQKIVSILESGVLMGSAQFGSSDFSDVGGGDEGEEELEHDSLSEGGRLGHDGDGDSLDGESSEITEMASSVVFAGPELVTAQPILDLDNDSLQGEAMMQLSSDSLILEQKLKTSDSAKFDTDSLIFDTDSLFEQEDRMVRSADSLELGSHSGRSSAGHSSEKQEEKVAQSEDQMQTSADSLELDTSKEESKEVAGREYHQEDSLMMGSVESAAWSMGSSGGTGQSMSESHTDSSQHDIMQVSTESDILKGGAKLDKSALSVEHRSEIFTEESHNIKKSEVYQWSQDESSVQYISEGAQPIHTSKSYLENQTKYKRKSPTQFETEEFFISERSEKIETKSKLKRESPKFSDKEDTEKDDNPFLSWGPYQETKKVYTMVEWEEMKRLKREKQEQEAKAAAQSSSSPDLSLEDTQHSSSSQSPPSIKMVMTSSTTSTSAHYRGVKSVYDERTSDDDEEGGAGKSEDDAYSSSAHGDDEDVQTHRLMMKKEVHKKTTIGLDGQEHTTIQEDSQVQQDNEPPEELRESMQEIINQFMESDPQPAQLLPPESKEDEV
ncbi:hypothetical protein Btru_036761 [Bulinus truncatus]|nr:hypothetical protein Btru_036761 [Bulinus truncatus]